MSVETDIEALKLRVKLLEEVVNKVQTVITNLATLEQLRQILLIKQQAVEGIQTDLSELATQVALLQAEIFK